MVRRGRERDAGKEQFWRRMLGLWRQSRCSVRDFCVEHGVSEPSFYAWRRSIAQRDRHTSLTPERFTEGLCSFRH